MKGNQLFVLSLAACLLAGCVSQSKYKELEAKALTVKTALAKLA